MIPQVQSKAPPLNSDLEATVSYLFMVGGRALRTKPPGARIEPPPKKPVRGREADTFFVLATPAQGPQATSAFYEQIASLACELYFRTSASVTSGLREVMNGVNSHLMTHNATAGEKYQVNLAAMVLRGHELFLARAGACITLLRQGADLITAPDDLRDEFALMGLPLGYSPSPDVKLAHYEIEPGHVFVMSDLGLANAPRDTLRDALASSAVQDALKAAAAPQTQAVMIEFKMIDPAVRQAEAAKSAPIKAPPAPIKAAVATPEAAITESTSDGTPPIVTGTEPAAPPAPVAPANEALTAPPKPLPARILYAVTHGIAWLLRGIARIINGLLDRVFPEPKEGTPNFPLSVAIGVAILIPVVVVFVMVGFRLSQVDSTNFEQLVNQVQEQANQAAAVPKSDLDRSKAMWTGVMQRIEIADVQRPGDPTLTKLRAQAQAALDDFAKVTRRTLIPLRTFPNNANLTSVFIQGGTDLYTLDQTSSAIYRDSLRTPDQINGQRGQTPLIQAGAPASNYNVRNIIDTLWVDEAGIRTSHALIGLDMQGILVTYSPAFPPANAQALPGHELWKRPVALAVWQERLYILDPGANQIWRYVPSGTTYPNPPDPYFNQELNRNLTKAVDFGIDRRGSVYVLLADGTMKKFTTGEEQQFTLNNIPDGALKGANAMYLLDSPTGLSSIFIIDPVDQSIYEFTLAGTFQKRYKGPTDGALRKLSAIYVEGQSAYVADGNILYFFPIDQSQK